MLTIVKPDKLSSRSNPMQDEHLGSLWLFTGSCANEICYQPRFKGSACFSRFFQRYAQVTPGEYRQRQSDWG